MQYANPRILVHWHNLHCHIVQTVFDLSFCFQLIMLNIKFNPLKCFFGSEGHVALDRNPGPGYDTLLLRMIPGDLLSAFPHRQFHKLPGLLDSWAALPNSNPNACMPMQGGSLYHLYDGLWYDQAERRTHDLLCERRTRYRLSQPDTVWISSQADITTTCFKVRALYIYQMLKNACLVESCIVY